MAQHFLLTAAARDESLSLYEVMNFSDKKVLDTFASLRWGQATEQTCPYCGVVCAHRFVPLQKRWRCRECYKAFSVTSGTLFNNHKLSLKKILAAIVIYANAVKGLSALQLSRDLDIQYKTAFVLLHKLRESLWESQDKSQLEGEVEIDGAYMYTYVRPENKRTDRKDLRVKENQNKDKQIILVMRERTLQKDKGARRTMVFALPSEEAKDVMPVIQKYVRPGSTVITDEASGYTMLGRFYDHQVVNHSKEYQSQEGANENQAESYIARFRRMVMGQIHKLGPQNLEAYANEAAFREDHRRRSNGTFVLSVLDKCLASGQSRKWAKYWQRRGPEGARRYSPFQDANFPMV